MPTRPCFAAPYCGHVHAGLMVFCSKLQLLCTRVTPSLGLLALLSPHTFQQQVAGGMAWAHPADAVDVTGNGGSISDPDMLFETARIGSQLVL